jgi:hypothetical protein
MTGQPVMTLRWGRALRSAWAALALCWLLTQGLGIWHRSLHGEGRLSAQEAAAHSGVHGSALGHEAGDAVCALLDHLLLGASLPGVQVPPSAPDAWAFWLPISGDIGASQRLSLAYHARAPPHRV